jgi:hypothetical protein
MLIRARTLTVTRTIHFIVAPGRLEEHKQAAGEERRPGAGHRPEEGAGERRQEEEEGVHKRAAGEERKWVAEEERR